MRSRTWITLLLVFLTAGGAALAQGDKPASPRGQAAAQVGGQYEGRRYTGGKWIEVDYGRPILRGRTDVFGSGDNYGAKVNAGAPVWRVGANKSTRFHTEAALNFGGKSLPAGEYSLFVEAKASGWTLIFSNHEAQDSFDRNNKTALWGSYGYMQDKDALRVPMEVSTHSVSIDQLTLGFVDMTSAGGKLAIWWEKTVATAGFTAE